MHIIKRAGPRTNACGTPTEFLIGLETLSTTSVV